MDYNGATLWAATGHTLMLPNFTGYFKWDWGAKKMIFINLMKVDRHSIETV